LLRHNGKQDNGEICPTDRKQAASDSSVLALAGAEILLKALEDEGVEVIFRLSGRCGIAHL
jgi:hypothetical protein